MKLLVDILKWTESSLKLWQRDAARRLFEQEAGLSEEDYLQLYGLLKAAHGLVNPLDLTPVPLSAAHLPAAMKSGEAVVLKAMRDLKHVNRIAPAQTLKFAQTGMTVIYGGNGSGKSGYGRVMKRACRARDQVEKVHPDATDPAAQDRVPEATFDIEVGGEARSVKWESGQIPPDELSTIAVFDCHCARAYLTAEQDIAYLPYGLDVVENLANKVLPELTRRLELEIAGVVVDCQPFAHLLGETKVGRLIAGLSEKSDPERIKILSTLSEQETNRVAELDHALSEADPKARAQELRLSASRLKELTKRIDASLAWITDAAIAKLRKLDDSSQTAAKAEMLAAQAFRSNETLLPGTGDPVWKSLFEAARKFSAEAAYPDYGFPHTDAKAVCPLCQQLLIDGAERLTRFEKYIHEDAAKVAAEKRQQIEAAKTRIERANLAIGLNESLAAELTLFDESVVSITLNFEAAIEACRTSMLGAIATHSWDGVASLSENPRQRLRDLAARQFKSARTFERASDDAKKRELTAERDELQARQSLSGCLDSVLALVERLKLKCALEKCRKDLKTRPISDKSKEFASHAVTSALKTALDDEFNALGIGHIGTKLKERNDKGRMKYRLLLDLPTTNKLDEILSEGEQRTIAIGSFLAELGLANHSGGIVFDDPVSSLDHLRRQRVAKRLADQATRRQVIVLTHDTVFLRQLMDAIEERQVAHSMQFLEWQQNNPGHVIDGLPWEHQKYSDRIKCHETAQEAFAAMPWPAYPGQAESAAMRHEYDRLRATIERVVEEVVFNGVVVRFSDWIQVGKLNDVVGFSTAEHLELSRLHRRCHKIIDAHDPSSALNAPVPTAHDLEADISALKNVVNDIKTRRKSAK